MSLIEMYNILLKNFGQQNWWPIVEGKKCLYKKEFMERERTNEEIFEIMIGTILTQNTNWTNVVSAIINLKEKNVFSIDKIDKIEEKELSNLIKPAGYYNQKAKKLKNLVNFLKEKNINELRKFSTYELRKSLFSLWGVGYETADSIVLYGFNRAVFVVDAYTKRIFLRLGKINENFKYEDIRNFFEENLPKDIFIYKEYHALIVEFGKNLCKNKPFCNDCIFKANCSYLHKNAQSFAQTIQQN